MLRHRGVIQAVTLGIALGIIAPLQDNAVQESYVLKRPVLMQIHSSSSVSSHEKAVMQRRAERIANRIQFQTVDRRISAVRTFSSASKKDTLRPAAASSRMPAVPTGGTAPRTFSSSLFSVFSLPASSAASDFPAFGNAVHPVMEVPNWGDMRSASEWDRTYNEMDESDFVPVPAYTMNVLTTPMKQLLETRNDAETIKILTAKLYYSTRHFSAYDVDSAEFNADHPGIDLKLAEGTPAGAIAGGRIHAVRRDSEGLGLHLIIEHRAPDGQTYYSVYGHMQSISVKEGESVTSGQFVGTVGKTGFTTGPHIHLQIDRGEPNEESHTVYWPASAPTREEANKHTINPIEFIQKY